MSFPSVGATDSGWAATPSIESIGIPSGGVGDLILIVYAVNVPFGDPPPPDLTGFTTLTSVGTGTSDQIYMKVAYKTASTIGSTSVLIDVTGASTLSWATYRISGWDSIQFATASDSFGSQPDAPNLSIGVSDDYLWLSAAGWLGNYSLSAYPYANDQINEGWVNASGSSIATCTKNLNASSDNPSSFTTSGSPEWVAATIAILPTASGPVVYGYAVENEDTGSGTIDFITPSVGYAVENADTLGRPAVEGNDYSLFAVNPLAPFWSPDLEKPDRCSFIAPYGQSIEGADTCTFFMAGSGPVTEQPDICTFSMTGKAQCTLIKVWIAGFWVVGLPRVYAGGHWNNFPGVKVFNGSTWEGCD